MTAGIGTDIVEVSRFNSWVDNKDKLNRFFNEKEMYPENKNKNLAAEHYASRFAVKEAFAKAMGTGFRDFDLKDVYVTNDNMGKPLLNVENNAEKLMKEKFGNYKLFVTISHEKAYAIAFVLIEN